MHVFLSLLDGELCVFHLLFGCFDGKIDFSCNWVFIDVLLFVFDSVIWGRFVEL